MEADSWNRLISAHSASDLYMDYDQMDVGGDEPKSEFPCPFCSQDFDIVGLCCHIYECHSAEANNGVCPICCSRVEMDVVGHITMEHGSFFKVPNRRRLHKDHSGSNSRTSFRRKERQQENIQSLDDGSSYPQTHERTDPLLWAFVSTFSPAEPSKNARPPSLHDEESKLNEELNDDSPNSGRLVNGREGKSEDHEEQSRRSQFLRDLLLSTIFKDSR